MNHPNGGGGLSEPDGVLGGDGNLAWLCDAALSPRALGSPRVSLQSPRHVWPIGPAATPMGLTSMGDVDALARLAAVAKEVHSETYPPSSSYRGVVKNPNDGRWMAQLVGPNNTAMMLCGKFDTEMEAARKYDDMARERFGSTAILNFPTEEDLRCGRRWVFDLVPLPQTDVELEQSAYGNGSTNINTPGGGGGATRGPSASPPHEFSNNTRMGNGAHNNELSRHLMTPPVVPQPHHLHHHHHQQQQHHQHVAANAAAAQAAAAAAAAAAANRRRKPTPVPIVHAEDDRASKKPRSKNPSSAYLGVSKLSKTGRWQARIRVKDVNIQLGSFATEQEAALRYDQGAREHHGDRAVLNFPTDEDFAVGRKWALQRSKGDAAAAATVVAAAASAAAAGAATRSSSGGSGGGRRSKPKHDDDDDDDE